MAFLDERYLLNGAASEEIFAAVRNLPIIDAHNHCDVKALADDRNFTDIWDCEAATDHYVWECLRKCGVPEELLTGKNHTNEEKWMAMAEKMPMVAGNATYEWLHLDLRRRLGIDLLINRENAGKIWEQAKAVLTSPEKSQQNLILEQNVETMCSTDDPADTLADHERLATSKLAGRVRPTFRPDKAMNIEKPDFAAYVRKLGARWQTEIGDLDTLIAVLRKAHDFFAAHGCRASDHGIEIPYGYQVEKPVAAEIFRKALRGETLTAQEVIAYHSYLLNATAEMDAEKDFVFQLHIGAVRDVRTSLYDALGPDVGGDISDHLTDIVTPLLPLLNRFDNRLKTVLYNLNPIHNGTLAQLSRAFGEKVCLGLAWWLNDSYIGMKTQLDYCASIDMLSNMAGMVSDSRKILSYGSRHEVFRRTMAAALGGMVDRGQMPLSVAVEIGTRMAYGRQKEFFRF